MQQRSDRRLRQRQHDLRRAEPYQDRSRLLHAGHVHERCLAASRRAAIRAISTSSGTRKTSASSTMPTTIPTTRRNHLYRLDRRSRSIRAMRWCGGPSRSDRVLTDLRFARMMSRLEPRTSPVSSVATTIKQTAPWALLVGGRFVRDAVFESPSTTSGSTMRTSRFRSPKIWRPATVRCSAMECAWRATRTSFGWRSWHSRSPLHPRSIPSSQLGPWPSRSPYYSAGPAFALRAP